MRAELTTLGSMRWVYVALLVYVAGFAAFLPRVLLIVDEERYVSQAVAFADGATAIPGAEIILPARDVQTISNYPPGTSLLQTPFVWLLGWRGAALVSVLGLCVATLVTAQWLRRSGRPPAFALLVPGYVGAAFFGRIAMSDVPVTALVAVTCLLLWRSAPERRRTSALAGASLGAIVLFREPVVLLLAPLAVGALARRKVAVLPFVAGGLAMVLARLLLAAGLFGSALYVRDPELGFGLSSLVHTLPVYATLLFIVIPGGALLPFLYRGERRIELRLGVAAYVALFLVYDYDVVAENGLLKGFLLASRFMIPLLPLMAWMAADVAPRTALARDTLARTGIAAVLLLAFLIHPIARRQETIPLAIVAAAQAHTREAAPVITNSNATLKYFSGVYGRRRLILRYGLDGERVRSLSRTFPQLSVALLDRSDTEMFRRESADNAVFMTAIRARCAVSNTLDSTYGGWARLHVYELRECR